IGGQGKEIGSFLDDLEIAGPLMASVVGGGAFRNENGSGDSVDVEVALWEAIGEHGNEGIAGFRSVVGIVHCLVNQDC
ncbi:hypothetical protein HMPREF3039_02105, partial [Akkermansia sp. KLE1798]